MWLGRIYFDGLFNFCHWLFCCLMTSTVRRGQWAWQARPKFSGPLQAVAQVLYVSCVLFSNVCLSGVHVVYAGVSELFISIFGLTVVYELWVCLFDECMRSCIMFVVCRMFSLSNCFVFECKNFPSIWCLVKVLPFHKKSTKQGYYQSLFHIDLLLSIISLQYIWLAIRKDG